MTNKDKLNAMSNKEFARFLVKIRAGCRVCAFEFKSENCLNRNCLQGYQKWLESEAENEEQTN